MKETRPGVTVEAYFAGAFRKRGHEAGGGEALEVDHIIVAGFADKMYDAVQVGILVLSFIPDDDFGEIRVLEQEAFVAFAEEKIDAGAGKILMQFLDEGSGEDDIAEKSGLYDKEFIQCFELRAQS
jgi:hypothetical protein